MNLSRSIDDLQAALHNVDQAIVALEVLQERQEQRQAPISSSSVEELISERQAVLQAIAQVEKLKPAPRPEGLRLWVGAGTDLASRRRWAHASRRYDLECPRNEDGY